VPPLRAHALILRTFEYSENSQVAHVLTREHGRVHGLAKGARRLNGAFHGGLDALALGDLGLYARRPGAGLRTFASFRVRTHFPGLRRRLARFHAAEHVRALVLSFAREEQAGPELFELTVSVLRMLELATDDEASVLGLGFEAMVLGLSGFAPELTRCVRCERPARNVHTARLSVLRGGLLCRGCRGEDPGASEIDGRAVAALVALGEGPLVRTARLPADPALRDELAAALGSWTASVLDRRLATRAAMMRRGAAAG
jgi:DNA repair protein RecO (recombination protein O)